MSVRHSTQDARRTAPLAGECISVAVAVAVGASLAEHEHVHARGVPFTSDPGAQLPAASSQQPVAHDLRVCDASRSPLEHSRPRPSPSPSPSPRPCPRRTRHGQPVDGRRYDTPSTGTGSSGWDAPPSPSLSLSLSLSLSPSPCAARASSSSSSPSPSPAASRQPPAASHQPPAAGCKCSQLSDATASSRRSPDGAGAQRAEDGAR